MGQTVECSARVDGHEDRGTALLETDEVIYRGGAARARVPFASVRKMVVKSGWLVIAHGPRGKLELELGRRAATWEERIRAPKGLVEKLGVKAGARVAMVGMKDEALAGDLAKVGKVTSGAPRGEVDVILVRIASEKELGRVPGLAEKLAPDGALWIVRPKGKDGVAESAVFAAGRGAGLVDVKVARWSETDTGLKFVSPKGARESRAGGKSEKTKTAR